MPLHTVEERQDQHRQSTLSFREAQFEGMERRQTEDHGVRIALLEQSTEAIKDQLKAINENITKLVWLIFSALILAIMKMVVLGV
jgi:hypothetical protein